MRNMQAFSLTTVTVAAALLVAVVAAADGNICCTPDQWEAGLSFYRAGCRHPYVSGYGRVAYDYKNKLMATKLIISVRGKTIGQHYLVDGKSRKAYVIGGRGERCHMASDVDMHQACVPGHFKHEGSFSYGDESSGRLASNLFTMSQRRVKIILAATQKLCTPLFATLVAGGSASSVSVFNMTLGIKDSSVFNIPTHCARADSVNDVVGAPGFQLLMRQTRSLRQTSLNDIFGLAGM